MTRSDGDVAFDAWAEVVMAMPIPAALVDERGDVLVGNRWLRTEPGERLLRSDSFHDNARRFSVDGGRWRVVPMSPDGAVLLATGEREDTSDQLMRQFFSSSSDSLFVVYDQAGLIVESNTAWERLLGYTRDEVYGLSSWSLLPEEDQSDRERVEFELREHGHAETDYRMRTKSGEFRRVRWSLRFDMNFGRCFGIGRDVTEQEKATAELERRAYHDELTGLANRAFLLERLDAALAVGASPALLFCDLDRFKIVNDSLGHQAGDLLLADLAARLSGVPMGDDAVLARFGGDEFVVLLEDGSAERACRSAARLLDSLAAPFEVAGRPIHVTMSIGISTPRAAVDRNAEELLGEADTAAYVAKDRGRNRWVVFDEPLHAAAERRLEMEVDLRRAIVDGRIEAYYQPIVSIPTGEVIGAEALVRWNDGERMIAPGQFLDVAEDAGLMPELGAVVIDQTIATARRLAEMGSPSLLMSVNVSDLELRTPEFCTRFNDSVLGAGLDPGSFLIEITESVILDTDSALPVLRRLKAAGFRLGLDDFGTGYSSLSHLRELPIDVVKVDRSFVAGLVDDDVTHSLTSSLVGLCSAVGLDVIAEGVETAQQARALEHIGATTAQGFLFHRPLPQGEFVALATHRGVRG